MNSSGLDPYVMQDVSFRIDPVVNDGDGDVGDYVLKSIDHTSVKDCLSAVANRIIMRCFFGL
jgi:hypothetical protein